jgi:hypothetical protein
MLIKSGRKSLKYQNLFKKVKMMEFAEMSPKVKECPML